jgi:hypothetical protein
METINLISCHHCSTGTQFSFKNILSALNNPNKSFSYELAGLSGEKMNRNIIVDRVNIGAVIQIHGENLELDNTIFKKKDPGLRDVWFLNEKCIVQFMKYPQGRTAILLRVKETGEPMAKATINIPYEKQEEGEVFIKDYSENEGMVKALYESGIIDIPHRYINNGRTEIPVCKLKVKPQV